MPSLQVWKWWPLGTVLHRNLSTTSSKDTSSLKRCETSASTAFGTGDLGSSALIDPSTRTAWISVVITPQYSQYQFKIPSGVIILFNLFSLIREYLDRTSALILNILTGRVYPVARSWLCSPLDTNPIYTCKWKSVPFKSHSLFLIMQTNSYHCWEDTTYVYYSMPSRADKMITLSIKHTHHRHSHCCHPLYQFAEDVSQLVMTHTHIWDHLYRQSIRLVFPIFWTDQDCQYMGGSSPTMSIYPYIWYTTNTYSSIC